MSVASIVRDPYERAFDTARSFGEPRALVSAPTDDVADLDTRGGTAPPAAGADTPDSSGPVFLDLPDIPLHGTGHASRWWRWGFPTAMVVAVVAVPLLILSGVRLILTSDNGRLILGATDPTKPGWEAAVPPTPTALIATLSDKGELSSVSLLTLSTNDSTGIVFIPADTQATAASGNQTLVAAYKSGGAAGLKAAVEGIIHMDAGDVTVADAAAWEALVAPIGTVTVANPDTVTVNGARLFDRGSIDITPARVGEYLRSRNWAEDDTNRLLRQGAFWRAWLAKIAANGTAAAVPGETNSGIGKFIRTLAATKVDYSVLPVKVQPLPNAYASVYVPIVADMATLLSRDVPFPRATPPGSRPTVRVLDGTGRLDHGLAVARLLAAAGAEIAGIGNASSFTVPTTQIIITGPDRRASADSLRTALGFGEVIERSSSPFSSDSIAVTVILGADALGRGATSGTSPGTVAGTAGR